MESERVHARAAIMRAGVDHEGAGGRGRIQAGWLSWLTDCGVPAITDLDTRALVRHIRDRGSMRGGVFPIALGEDRARELIKAEPEMSGRNLAGDVSSNQLTVLEATGGEDGPRIAMIDTGVKLSIVNNLRSRGVVVELHPYMTSAEGLLASAPDAIFLANGPGDPAALDHVVETVRALVGKLPVYGICLGHQLLCRAVGLDTYKLRFGHHGAQPSGPKTCQQEGPRSPARTHGFAVLGPDGARTIDDDEPVRWETDFGAAELTHINLYDRTVEGLLLRDVQGATVQYHPEAGPGPHDALHLFDRFVDEIKAAA